MREYLYYQDSMMKEFQAQVIRTDTEEGRPYVVLSNTAFYPTGGGQPNDTGYIENIPVVDVEKVEDEIRHYIEGDPSTLVEKVHGVLNWERRFDHMQQHAGQHILTAAFVECFNFATISFHLGSELVTIDLNTDDISEEQLKLAEKRANEIILENRPIETKWVTQEQLSQYKLRKDVTVEEDIRLVIIPDYDYNGCGGTHPTSTGQVSAIKIMGIEKMKKNIRVSFVCGGRVLDQLAMRKRVLSDVAHQLSVPEEDASTALQKVLTSAKSNEKALADAQEKLLEYEAIELVAESKENVIAVSFENRSVQTLQKLGRLIVAQNDDAIVFLVTDNYDKLQFVAAKGTTVNKSMKEISNAILPLINGKGGGNDSFVQGGGEKLISTSELLEQMETQL